MFTIAAMIVLIAKNFCKFSQIIHLSLATAKNTKTPDQICIIKILPASLY